MKVKKLLRFLLVTSTMYFPVRLLALKVTEAYKRLLELTEAYWSLLELTGAHYNLLQLTRAY